MKNSSEKLSKEKIKKKVNLRIKVDDDSDDSINWDLDD